MSEYIINDEQIAENRRLHGKKLLVMPVIVRCRDCAKADYAEVHMFDGTRPMKWTCTRFKGFHHMVQPDGFCSRGARREP